MVRRRFASTRTLEPGMIIDQSIVDRSGRVLIARKTVLDEFLIRELAGLANGVYIREGKEEPEDLEMTLEAGKKLRNWKNRIK